MVGPTSVLCGQLLVVGLAGTELSKSEQQAFQRGERGGVVLFKRNLLADADAPRGVLSLSKALAAASELPPLVAIDQEGGRVVRIGPPALALPAMRRVGDLNDTDLAYRLAETQARELAALGITLSFAPITDIHTRPENPVIGERAFAGTPTDVARFALAWAKGLVGGGVLSCAKHFPGHGDTSVDSHFELPRVERSREELERIEIAPFRAIAKDPAVTSMMTAHVIYTALDSVPGTLSRAINTELLRTDIGFGGVLFSDDMEMKAIKLPMGEAAVLAIGAGCDALNICHREDLAEEALAALVREAESSPAFRARCEEAHARFVAMRRRVPPRPALDEPALARAFEASRAVAAELGARLGPAPAKEPS